MKLHSLKLAFLFTCLTFAGHSAAQVTIGDNTLPVTGALLQLKDGTVTDNPLVNSMKGFGLPRVLLTSKDNLFPMFTAGSPEYSGANKATADAAHAGLIVYHINSLTLSGDGVYIWTGTEWQILGGETVVEVAGLNISVEDLVYLSGVSNATQDVDISWGPSSLPSPTYTTTGLSYTITPASGSLGASPQTVSIRIADMTAAEINANPFRVKTGTVTFTLTDPSAGGKTDTKTINVKQINKGVKINNKLSPDDVSVTASATLNAMIESNAQWKLSSISPAVNPAVTSTEVGKVMGAEYDDGTAAPKVNIPYKVTVASGLSRYNYLTFSDAQTPKRFNDVVLTVAQCTGSTDLTMEQYKDLWQKMYGLNPEEDTPDTDGDVTKNTNRVQWHRDQSGNIFFSSIFAGQRWMTTNLAATKYDTGISSPPGLYNGFTSSTASAYYAYPNVDDTKDAGLKTAYNARERIGLLYNWHAATAGKNTSTANQTGVHNNYQGICPNGWRLPRYDEFNDLLTEFMTNARKYSTNSDYPKYPSITMIDMCEPTTSRKCLSFSILDGGFSQILPGAISSYNKTYWYGFAVFVWSSSSSSGTAAYHFYMEDVGATFETYGRTGFGSVRCVKN